MTDPNAPNIVAQDDPEPSAETVQERPDQTLKTVKDGDATDLTRLIPAGLTTQFIIDRTELPFCTAVQIMPVFPRLCATGLDHREDERRADLTIAVISGADSLRPKKRPTVGCDQLGENCSAGVVLSS